MSFLQILPEELTAAATQLGALGTSMAAQNAAAASCVPDSGVTRIA
ncbi:PE domain-containing protein [Mycobacterium riyadhense]|nr:PE domain-containing protein [Mycobacterium riyadhense]